MLTPHLQEKGWEGELGLGILPAPPRVSLPSRQDLLGLRPGPSGASPAPGDSHRPIPKCHFAKLAWCCHCLPCWPADSSHSEPPTEQQSLGTMEAPCCPDVLGSKLIKKLSFPVSAGPSHDDTGSTGRRGAARHMARGGWGRGRATLCPCGFWEVCGFSVLGSPWHGLCF